MLNCVLFINIYIYFAFQICNISNLKRRKMSQQTLLYVSKAHMQSVKRLYKIIFQLHRSLPPEMRDIGNTYVRNEFKLHKNASPEQAKVFITEWGVSLDFIFLIIYIQSQFTYINSNLFLFFNFKELYKNSI